MKTVVLTAGIAVLVLGGILVYAFAFNTYTSSPGFTSREQAAEFYANAPTCYGWSILLNRDAVAADAPGESVCIGYLNR